MTYPKLLTERRYNHPREIHDHLLRPGRYALPTSTGLWHAIKERMNIYMAERMGFAPAEIPHLREKYYLQYGTTLRGLQANHEIDVEDFLAFVHDLPLATTSNPTLICAKLSLRSEPATWSSPTRIQLTLDGY